MPGNKKEPIIGSRWCRNTPHDPEKGPYNGYTVLFITNTAFIHPNHRPQVVYRGDNGHVWSRSWLNWPGDLIREEEKDYD